LIPTVAAPESTVGLVRDGYTFISRRCDRLGTDAFRARLMLRPAVCMRGPDAARVFYADDERFTRRGAMPTSLLRLLQDEGSAQWLDGRAHRHRKDMFLGLLTADNTPLLEAFEREWRAALPRWRARGEVVLHDELEELLTRAAMSWAGVPRTVQDVPRRARELSAMVARAGSVGPTNWWARALRRRCERWASTLVDGVRSGDLHPPEGSALAVIASHRDDGDRLLEPRVAAVELINVLRPTVAVARYVDFAALALLRHPRWRDDFAAGREDDLWGFVHEVRRFYPFFPLVGGRVRRPFTWHHHDFALDDWVLLDLYGTNHDPRVWTDPEAFRPERFRGWEPDPYTLVPQGAGDLATTHRCPGEPATVALVAQAVRLLTRSVRYRVGVQDLTVGLNLADAPPKPRDGFRIQDVMPA
jgi:fatty-acid peroxygenase